MIGLEITFLTGRYHATPWNRHVNEGQVAWPPSPWQILRALIATWHLKAQEIEEAKIRDLIDALSLDLPCYVLPPTKGAHTRHYMPIEKDKTTRVLDAFLQIAPNRVLQIAWPHITLDADQRNTLDTLISRIGYLGRAESWAEVKSWDGPAPAQWDAAPLESFGDAAGDIVSLLLPMQPKAYENWRAQTIDQRDQDALAEKRAKEAAKGKPTDKVKLTPKDYEKLSDGLAPDLFTALQASTGDARKGGWSLMPGAEWVRYRRVPSERPVIRPPVRRASGVASCNVVRFALSSAVLPSITDAFYLGHKLHKALVEKSCNWEGVSPETKRLFTGCDENRQPLKGHQHLYILPESNDRERRGRITHVTLYAPHGFPEDSRRVLESLSVVHRRNGHHLNMVLIGVGRPADFVSTDGQADMDKGQCALLATSRVWVSETPFVATRHVKTKKDDAKGGHVIGSPEHDLWRLIEESERFGQPISVTRYCNNPEKRAEIGGREFPWLAFATDRAEDKRPSTPAVGLRVEFANPVQGPLVFGYGAHYGLGQFRPEPEQKQTT